MTYNPKRQYRRKKGDRLITPDASRNQVACDHAVAPFDRMALAMEEKWGIDKLVELVSPATAEKFGVTMANLNAAIASDVPADVVACAESAIRGLTFMDAEATRLGHTPPTGEFWEFELEAEAGGPFRFAVTRDSREWKQIAAQRPDLQIFTMREVALALTHYAQGKLAVEAKRHFPKAQIAKVAPPVNYAAGGDSIPF